MKKETRILPMARINTRIRPDQHKYIKTVAKNTKQTEGEVFRAIIDVSIAMNPKVLNKK